MRGVSRLLLRHASGDVFFDLPLDVILKLLVQFLLDLATAEDRAQAQRYGVEPMFETHLGKPPWVAPRARRRRAGIQPKSQFLLISLARSHCFSLLCPDV